MNVRRVIGLFVSCVLPLCAVGQTTRAAIQAGLVANSITGRIVTDDGQPGARMRVFATSIGSNTARRSATSDDDGRFSFTLLPPTVYRVGIVHQGDLVEGQSPESEHVLPGSSITLVLRKGGVITGRVLTSTGEPLVEGAMSAIRIRDEDDRPVIGADRTVRDQVLTDDRGIYRIYGLRPGGYLVLMAAGWWGASVYSEDIPTYYPSSNRETASVVVVHAGEEITGIDIRHRGDAGRTVSGRVKWWAGLRASTVSWMLIDRSTLAIAASAYVRQGGSDPRFEFYAVADGDYNLVAESGSRNEEKSTSLPRHILVQGADISGVEVTMTPLASIAGRVVLESLIEGQKACPGSRRWVVQEATVQLMRESPRLGRGSLGSLPETVADSRNEFTIGGIQPGYYHVGCFLPSESLYLRAITTRTQNLSKEGLRLAPADRVSGVTVTLAEGAAAVSGRVANSNSKRFRVHLVPSDKERGDDPAYFYEIVAARDGSFLLTHVAPGSYWAIAREIPLNESLESESQVAWDATVRSKLRIAAEVEKNELKLSPCQKVESYSIAFRAK
jgi:hypothetical protein